MGRIHSNPTVPGEGAMGRMHRAPRRTLRVDVGLLGLSLVPKCTAGRGTRQGGLAATEATGGARWIACIVYRTWVEGRRCIPTGPPISRQPSRATLGPGLTTAEPSHRALLLPLYWPPGPLVRWSTCPLSARPQARGADPAQAARHAQCGAPGGRVRGRGGGAPGAGGCMCVKRQVQVQGGGAPGGCGRGRGGGARGAGRVCRGRCRRTAGCTWCGWAGVLQCRGGGASCAVGALGVCAVGARGAFTCCRLGSGRHGAASVLRAALPAVFYL